MHRARDPIMAASFPLAPGVHRPRRPQPCLDRTRLSVHPKQARYSTDYAQICGTNIMRGTRGQTSKPEKPTKGVKPIRDKDGKITGWIVPTPDGKGKAKTLEWGKANGLDPANFKMDANTGLLGGAMGLGAYIWSTAPEWAPELGALAIAP